MNQIFQLHCVYIPSLIMERVNKGVEDEFSEKIQTSADIWWFGCLINCERLWTMYELCDTLTINFI